MLEDGPAEAAGAGELLVHLGGDGVHDGEPPLDLLDDRLLLCQSAGAETQLAKSRQP